MKKYSVYKDSGIDWIGAIPEDWKVQKFKYNFMTTTGVSITRDELSDTGIYCLGYGPIHSRLGMDLDLLQDKLTKAPYSYYRKSALADVGDFIFCDTSEDIEGCGNNVHVKELHSYELLAGSHTILAKPINLFNSRYLAYLFETNGWRSQIQSQVFGVKVNSITQKILRDTYIILPNIMIQDQIVSFLDIKISNINAGIQGKQKLIELLKEKRQAIITQVVSKGLDSTIPMKASGVGWIGEIPENWDITKVKNIVEGIKDGTHGSFNRVPVGKQLLSAKNVFEDGLLLSENESLISEEDFTGITSNGYPRKNDVLLCSVGTIGRSCLYTYDEPFAFQRSVMFLRPNYKILPQYLHYFVISSIFQNELKSKINMAAQGGVYMGTVNNMMVILPSLSIQTKLVEYLNQELTRLDSVLIILTSEIVKLKEYRQSIISEAVTGKVVV